MKRSLDTIVSCVAVLFVSLVNIRFSTHIICWCPSGRWEKVGLKLLQPCLIEITAEGETRGATNEAAEQG